MNTTVSYWGRLMHLLKLILSPSYAEDWRDQKEQRRRTIADMYIRYFSAKCDNPVTEDHIKNSVKWMEGVLKNKDISSEDFAYIKGIIEGFKTKIPKGHEEMEVLEAERQSRLAEGKGEKQKIPPHLLKRAELIKKYERQREIDANRKKIRLVTAGDSSEDVVAG